MFEALGEGIESFSGVLEDTWTELSKDFLGETEVANLTEGAKVFTSQGSGTIVAYIEESNSYEVQLDEDAGGEKVTLVKGLVLPAPPIELTEDMQSLIPPELHEKLDSFLTDEIRAEVGDTLSKGRMMWATLYTKKPELFNKVSGVLSSSDIAGHVKQVQETLATLLENNKGLLDEGKAKLTEIADKVEASGLGDAVKEAREKVEKAVEGNENVKVVTEKVQELSKGRRATAILDRLQTLALNVQKTDAAKKLMSDVATEGKI